MKPNVQNYVVSDDKANKRFDAVVRDFFALSWNQTRDWIRRGKLFVNEQAVCDLQFAVKSGDKISLRLDVPRIPPQEQIDKSLIAYVDQHLIVVRKPSGILSVPYEGHECDTLDKQVRRLLSQIAPRTPKSANRSTLYVVHRLDRNTSGLIVFARSTSARDSLSEQFRAHTIIRRYLALVHGQVLSQTIRSHLVTNRGDGLRGSSEIAPSPQIRHAKKGKVAITHIKLLESLRDASLIECILETGRTNQIRIHLSEQEHPIIGETIYMRDYCGTIIEANRLMLHAATLGFIHPISGKLLQFEDPNPIEFDEMLQTLR